MGLRFLFMMFAYTPVALLVSVWRPFWGLLMLVVLYYFRPDVWTTATWFRPILWITIAVGVGWALQARRVRFHPIMGLSLVILLGSVASALVAGGSRDLAIAASWTLAKLMIVQFLTLQLVDTPSKARQFLWANVVGMLWNLKTILVIGVRGGDVERVNVAVGQGGGANYLALVLIMSIPFFTIRFQEGTKKERWYAGILIPLYVLGAVFTGSRAGLLQLAAIMSYLVARSKKKVLASGLAIMIASIVVLTLPEAQWERFKQGFESGDKQDFSAKSRTLLWQQAWVMFRESPILGKGMDNYQVLSPRYVGFYAGKTPRPWTPGSTGPGFVTHSTWFQTLAEHGAVGSIPFFALFPMAFFALARSRRVRGDPEYQKSADSLATAMVGLWIAFIVASTFGSHMKLDFLWWYMGLTAALRINGMEREGVIQAYRHQEMRNRQSAAALDRVEERQSLRVGLGNSPEQA